MEASQASYAGSIPVPRSIIFMRINFNFILRPAICVGLMYLAGCATVSPKPPILKPTQPGVYHKVKKGQTLWRVAKTYNIPISDIIRINNIPDVAKVEENQLIFIPGATSVKEVILSKEDIQKDFIWPVNGKIINYFREHKGSWVNKGIDIQAQEGDTVKASRSGSVVLADYLPGYGYTVILDHGDGFYTVYGHNAHLLVKLGDAVPRNAPIAQVGSQSDLAYLHFQIRKNGIEDNPLYYLP